MTDEMMVTVQAADLLMVLRHVNPGLSDAEQAAVERLRTAAYGAADKAAEDAAEETQAEAIEQEGP